MQAVGQNPDAILPLRVTEEFANEEYRKDGNLYFDQSVFKSHSSKRTGASMTLKSQKQQSTVQKIKSKLKRSERVDSMASEQSSDDSDLSDDAFIN